jgi:hypothetical protein
LVPLPIEICIEESALPAGSEAVPDIEVIELYKPPAEGTNIDETGATPLIVPAPAGAPEYPEPAEAVIAEGEKELKLIPEVKDILPPEPPPA